jgi:hypothetical protein
VSSSDLIGLAGLGISIVGFSLTVWQLLRTANAAIATKEAIVAANKRMLLNHLLVLLPQLKTLEADLDTAIAAKNSEAAIRALIGYSHAANQVASLLDSQEDSMDAELVKELRASAVNASANKAVLVIGTTRQLSSVLKTVASEISAVSAKCAGLSTKYQVKVA